VCSRRSGTSATGSSLSSPTKGRSRTAASLSDQLVEKARRRFHRITAEQAATELAAGALLVDIRTNEQRRLDGAIPGARAIERTTLEWRLDPTSPWRSGDLTTHDARVIVICAEGFSSSLAAASLRDLGLTNTTDVIDGVAAWKAAGLPIER
jgi:rhodanese-related sulfurtransferase